MFVINGFDLIGGGNKTNVATMFVPLEGLVASARSPRRSVARDIFMRGMALTDGMALAFNPPAIRGLGTRRRLRGLRAGARRRRSAAAAAGRPGASSASCSAHPQLQGINTLLPADRAAAAGRGRSREGDVARRLGAGRVRDAAEHDGHALRERLQQVRAHLPGAAAGRCRSIARKPEDLGNVFVRSSTSGEMIPLKTADHASAAWSAPSSSSASTASSPPRCSAPASPGVSSGDALRAVEEVAARALPAGLPDRVDRAGLPGKAQRQRVAVRVRLRARDGAT